jgi:hypothetical protein
MGFILMPKVESDRANTHVTLPVGTPLKQVEVVRDRLLAALDKVVAEHGGARLSKGAFAMVNENQVSVRAYLQPPDVRPISTAQLVKLWRKEVGVIPGAESSRYESDRGGPGSGVTTRSRCWFVCLRMNGLNFTILSTVKTELLPALLSDYPGLSYRFEGRQASMRDASVDGVSPQHDQCHGYDCLRGAWLTTHW